MNNDDATIPLFADDIARTSIRGRNVAEENTDPAWADGALSAIREMARSGRQFQANDVARAYKLGEPDHPCRWGAVFARAHREGLIVRVGAAQSTRRTVNRSLTSVWRGPVDLITADSAEAA